MAGLYIHIPFCKQACSYCDFYFVTRGKLKQPFTEALVREINSYRSTPFVEEEIRSVYIGGGTPSQLTLSQHEKIFRALEETFCLNLEEVTMELNPDDVTENYLKGLLDLGVNRASMGIQSFNEDLLQFMHRAHNREEALKALEMLHRAGFPTYSADLIYGNPGQTTGMLKKDIDQMLEFNPPHISAYSLTVEPQTRLGKQVQLGRISPPEDEAVSEHFDILYSALSDAGIEQYEVSNFSIPGKEALHNSNYWRHKNYLGLGPAAHSFWWNESNARRWVNRPDIKQYLEKEGAELIEHTETLSLNTLAEERLMLGLRTKWGVKVQELHDRYNYKLTHDQLNFLNRQINERMFQPDEDVLILTPNGLKIADLLIVDLLSKRG